MIMNTALIQELADSIKNHYQKGSLKMKTRLKRGNTVL